MRDVTAVFVQHVHTAVLAGRLACVLSARPQCVPAVTVSMLWH